MRPVVMVDKQTRQVIKRFKSVAEAARFDGTCHEVMKAKCENRRLTRLWHYFRYEEDFDPDEDFTGRINCPVLVLDVDTGRVSFYPSRHVMAKETGFSVESIHSAVENGWKLDFQFRVADAGRRLVRREEAREIACKLA